MGNETTVWIHELEYLNYLAYHTSVWNSWDVVDKEDE